MILYRYVAIINNFRLLRIEKVDNSIIDVLDMKSVVRNILFYKVFIANSEIFA